MIGQRKTPGEDTLAAAVRMAAEAGQLILPFFEHGCSHELKADHSPITQADLASHAFLLKALGELTPERTVVSEESAVREASASGYWLIDPLDGTKEFLKGKREFTVNVALMDAHGPVLGVVHAPALGLTYYGEKGRGAWRQVAVKPAEAIRTRSAALERLTVVASKDHSGPRVKRFLEKLASPSLSAIGSSLKFCLVAEGRADLYYRDGPTMEWDTAAAQCVLECAGGVVLELSGAPLGYSKPDLRNPAFVAVGDPDFPWKSLTPATEREAGFAAFFAEIGREIEFDSGRAR